MNKKKISHLILRQVSGLQVSSNSFFHNNFQHVLNGIHLEYVPGGIYLWHLVFPLYDNFGFNLLYSQRIAGDSGYIHTESKSNEEIANEVLSSSASQLVAEASDPLRISDFIGILERDPALLRNAHVRMTYGISLLLNHQEESALTNFRLAELGLKGRDIEDFKRISEALRMGRSAALLVLNDIQNRVFRDLSIKGTVKALS